MPDPLDDYEAPPLTVDPADATKTYVIKRTTRQGYAEELLNVYAADGWTVEHVFYAEPEKGETAFVLILRHAR